MNECILCLSIIVTYSYFEILLYVDSFNNYTVYVLQIIRGGMVFVDRLVPQNFSSEIACTIGFGRGRLPSNCKTFLANESLVLQLQNLSTLIDLQYTVDYYKQ